MSLVYDEATNSVAKSNTSHNISNQVHAQPENRQNKFPGYPHAFLPSQIITHASQYPPYNMIQVPVTRQQQIHQITPAS